MQMEVTASNFQKAAEILSRSNRGPQHFNIPLPPDLDDDVESLDPISELVDTSLPTLATANDVREVVRFFKNKPFGATVIEAMNAEPRRVFDARKIAAYEFWGILERSGERLKLSGMGQELAERIKPECEMHRRILRSIPTYLGALRSFYEQQLKIVTRIEAAIYWKDSHPELDLFKLDEKDIEAIAVSFFSVCHAAELGTMTVGKRGQPARLRIDLDELATFIECRDPAEDTTPLTPRPKPESKPLLFTRTGESNSVTGRVYLAAGNDGAVSDKNGQLQTVLELADLDDIVYQVEMPGNFLPQSELATMRQCQVAVFLIGSNDCIPNKIGELELSARKLVQISMAMAVLNNRVVVVWDSYGGEPPESIREINNLHICEGETLDWNTGTRLVRLLKSLRT
ncbi:MAG: hypothetical protein ACKVQJ_09390 [Pyrinomonadaceae bacterium]